MIHMEYYLIVSAIMFFAGIYGFFTRRNTLAILISIELILNATDINFAVFNRFLFPDGLEGYFFSLLLPVLHRHLGCRNGHCYCHHDQHLPQHPKHPGEQSGRNEVVILMD